jgi:starch synthase
MADPRVLLVAAENDALPGGKVGGIGDVVREVPPALARNGWTVDVVTPSHGFLHQASGAYWIGTIPFKFAGSPTSADVYAVPGKCRAPGVTHLVIDHPALVKPSDGRPQIYSDDPSDAPFASDASKYALFCAAVAECVIQELIKRPSCLHLHDWHAAFLLILRKYDPAYRGLQDIRTAYTIHNLALQGTRPFEGHPSSLVTWYPVVRPAGDLADPRWPGNVNPMAVGIRLADAVHTVSPSYAAEILARGDPPRRYGGEGLESDLSEAHRQRRLFGILNGCDYSETRVAARETFPALIDRLRSEVLKWVATRNVMSAAHGIALERLRSLDRVGEAPPMLLTSVSRVADQKLYLLRASGSDGSCGLQSVLETIKDLGVYVLLGTGDKGYQDFLVAMSARYPNFVFLNGFSDGCANALYGSGDLFVMPSSFEPCGIGQMLAMRDGQPCLVHGVGGLRDTVHDRLTGFVFHGDTVEQQVDGLRDACERAVILRVSDRPAWEAMRKRAAAARFLWNDTVASYISDLYTSPSARAVTIA